MTAILEVGTVVLVGFDRAILRGRFLDRPLAGEPVDPLVVSGWVIPQEAHAVAVEVVRNDEVVAHTSVSVGADGGRSGAFRVELDRSGIEPSPTLVVRAVLANGSMVPFGELRLRHTEVDGARSERRPGLITRLRRLA
jgi:hypothetical protein